MAWGTLSDRIGRKPVLLLGCIGTVLSLVMVGFATNIWIALIGRAAGGFLNGNIGVIQTMVGELVTRKEHERRFSSFLLFQNWVWSTFKKLLLTSVARAYSVMPFVWSIGTVIGPAIGGTLSNPCESFPNTFSQNGLFGRFPYLLPNLVCASLLVVSIVLGYLLLEETHPDMQPRILLPESTYSSEESPLIATADAIKVPAIDLRTERYGTFDGSDDSTWRNTQLKFAPPKIFTKQIVALVIAMGIFTYHSMTYDHLLPIFLEDERGEPYTSVSSIRQAGIGLISSVSAGGLGLSVQKVGMIMSCDGVIALFVQAVIFPFFAQKLGIHRLFILVSLLHPLSYFMMPFLVYLPERFMLSGIFACLTVRNILCIMAYPVILIMIKEATPSPNVLGKVNGLSASAGAACRTVAPPIAGYLYTLGSRMDFQGLAWYGSMLVAGIGAVQCFSVKRVRQTPDIEEDLKKDVVPFVTVTEVNSESDSEMEE